MTSNCHLAWCRSRPSRWTSTACAAAWSEGAPLCPGRSAMAEASIMSWKDKWMSLRRRHSEHIERAGEATQMVGQTIIASVGAFAIGVADQKWAKPEAGYTNLAMLKIGPLPVSMVIGAAGLGGAIWGHGEHWAPWAEAFGIAGAASYSAIQGRRMTIDWQAAKAKAA